MEWLPLLVFSYIIGSVPSGYIAGRILKGIDLRETGDGNVGAANAFVELGPNVGALVAAADVAKGALAVLLARTLTGSDTAALVAGGMAVAGHNWPLYLQFRGGRGAATSLGVLLILAPQVTVMLILAGAVPLLLYRSTRAFFICVFVPISPLMWFSGAPTEYIGYVTALPVMVGISHYLSIRRPDPSLKASTDNSTGLRA